MENENKKGLKTSPLLVILFIVLAVYTLMFLLPALWTVITSLKETRYYMQATVKKDLALMMGLEHLTLENFVTAYESFDIPIQSGERIHLIPMFGNSLLYAGGCAVIATIVPCVMAYLTARYDYQLGKIVHTIVLVTMAIPIVGALPSEMKMVDSLGLMDSVVGLYVLKANFLGIYFLVFYAQFKTIPKDYTEAASIDGASEWYIMVQIIFPIAFGAISTVLLLNFIQFWNDYQIPMIYWESRPVVAYGMYYFASRNTGKLGPTPIKLSAMIMVATPIIILFIIFNQQIMANMSIGGVKG